MLVTSILRLWRSSRLSWHGHGYSIHDDGGTQWRERVKYEKADAGVLGVRDWKLPRLGPVSGSGAGAAGTELGRCERWLDFDGAWANELGTAIRPRCIVPWWSR